MDWAGIKSKATKHFKNINSFESLPLTKLINETHWVNLDLVYSTLLAQRLTLSDAHINIRSYCFKLKDFYYENQSERKAAKTSVKGSSIPTKNETITLFLSSIPVSVDEITSQIDMLSPRRVKSCGNHIVMKGTLNSLVKTLESILIKSTEASISSTPFDKSSKRHEAICQWLEWLFKEKYNITTSFKPEEIRQIIKTNNIYSGRFTVDLIAF